MSQEFQRAFVLALPEVGTGYGDVWQQRNTLSTTAAQKSGHEAAKPTFIESSLQSGHQAPVPGPGPVLVRDSETLVVG